MKDDGQAGAWWLYLVRTAAGTLYTGISTDPDRRLREHEAGGVRGARALRGRGPLELAYRVRVGDRSAASRLEAAVKRLDRPRKEALVAGRLDPSGLIPPSHEQEQEQEQEA